MASAAAPAGIVCGVDEAGRGPLAGPVFAAAVVLDPARRIRGLADSKTLAEERREALAAAIREQALAWSVATANVEEIDRLNIFRATMLAMRRAVEGLRVAPEEAWIDGNHCPPGLACRARAFVQGDARHAPISAASILAKTARDAEMRALHERWPQYGFDRHKGYGTEDHLQAIGLHGPCEAHRRSFQPVGVFFQGELFREDWRALEDDARTRTYRFYCEVVRLCRRGGPRELRRARLEEGERRLREDYADILAAEATAPEVTEAERLLRSAREKLA